MNLLIPETVSEHILRCGVFEPSVTAYMLRFLRPGDVFLDVGAHFGYFTLLGAWLTGRTGQVHSFEPTPSTFLNLAGNVEPYQTVRANQVAVWSECTTIEISDFGPSFSAFNTAYGPRVGDGKSIAMGPQTIRVDAVTLDEYCHANDVVPHLVKIDAESAEGEIIRGMSGLLSRGRPAISIEVGDFDLRGVSRSAELLGSVMKYGYLPFKFDSVSVRQHHLQESYGYDNVLLLPVERVERELNGEGHIAVF
jgi:FkbM family methyltransferase